MSSNAPADQPFNPSVTPVNGTTNFLSVPTYKDSLPPIAGTGVGLDVEGVPYNFNHGHGTLQTVRGCSTSGSSVTLSTKRRFYRINVGQSVYLNGTLLGTVLAVASNYGSLTLSSAANVSANSTIVFV